MIFFFVVVDKNILKKYRFNNFVQQHPNAAGLKSKYATEQIRENFTTVF